MESQKCPLKNLARQRKMTATVHWGITKVRDGVKIRSRKWVGRNSNKISRLKTMSLKINGNFSWKVSSTLVEGSDSLCYDFKLTACYFCIWNCVKILIRLIRVAPLRSPSEFPPIIGRQFVGGVILRHWPWGRAICCKTFNRCNVKSMTRNNAQECQWIDCRILCFDIGIYHWFD